MKPLQIIYCRYYPTGWWEALQAPTDPLQAPKGSYRQLFPDIEPQRTIIKALNSANTTVSKIETLAIKLFVVIIILQAGGKHNRLLQAPTAAGS